MSIDLSSLGLPKAVIGKSTQPERPMRANAQKIKDDLQAAKNNGEVRDLLEVSGNIGQAERIADAATGDVRRISNYGSDVFFTREMPDQVDADGVYTVGGVKFSKDELAQARAVLTTAARGISAGPGRNTNLDYRTYAQMAVAEQAVDAYAKNNLSEEQRAVAGSAMREYNQALLDWQDTLLGTVPETTGSEYYGRAHAFSQNEADTLNMIKAELSRLTGRTFRPTVAGDPAGYDRVATNKTAIRDIQSVFAGADFSTASGRRSALDAYSALMRPVYQAQGIRTGLDSVLANDTASLSKMFDSILAKQHSPISLSL